MLERSGDGRPEYRLALARDGYTLVRCARAVFNRVGRSLLFGCLQTVRSRSDTAGGRMAYQLNLRARFCWAASDSSGRGWSGQGIPVSSAIANEVRGGRQPFVKAPLSQTAQRRK